MVRRGVGPMANTYLSNLARALLGQPFDDLSKREQQVIEALASGEPVAQNVNDVFIERTTFWQRLADRLAQIVGSWPFIFCFLIFLVVWMAVNTLILANMSADFDPYPYILLNLVLSTLASIQAPVIMMSQNRQNDKDRISSSNSFQVSLKIELALQQLHEKIDRMAPQQDADREGRST